MEIVTGPTIDPDDLDRICEVLRKHGVAEFSDGAIRIVFNQFASQAEEPARLDPDSSVAKAKEDFERDLYWSVGRGE